MQLIRINKNPSRRQMIVFAIVWLVFVTTWGFVASIRGNRTLALVLWFLATGIPLLGLIFPSCLRLVYLTLSYATYPVGLVVSHVVLVLVYYLGFTFLGFAMRVFRYDPLTLRRDARATSYWRERRQDKHPNTYFRQS